MKLAAINIDTKRSYKDRLVLAFWIYLLLVIFEGAFRKWIFPEFSNLFLVAREPVVIFAFIVGIQNERRLPKSFYFFVFISIFSFCTTLLFGHHNPIVALYGYRIYGLHLPCMFIFAKALSRDDILRVGKFSMLLLLMMTTILFFQYFSPQSSFINRGIGGSTEGSGFSGVGDYMRPSGTFSFTNGMAGFEFLVGCFVFYFLIDRNRYLSKAKVGALLFVFIISVFLCLSRTVIAEVSILLLGLAVCSFFSNKSVGNIFLSIIALCLIFIIAYNYISFFHLAVTNMMERFSQATEAEGDFVEGSIGNRVLGSFIRAFTDTQNFSNRPIPLFGFGMGAGSRVGATLLGGTDMLHTFAFAEEEGSEVVCEYGYVVGFFILESTLKSRTKLKY